MRYFAALLLAFLPVTSAGNTVPVTQSVIQVYGYRNDWTFTAIPGRLTAQRNGHEVWSTSGPFQHPTGLQVLVTNRQVILVSTDAQRNRVFFNAYDLTSGKALWQNKLFDNVVNAAARAVDFTPDTLLVQASSGEPMFGKVLGLDLKSGKTRWVSRQDFLGHDGKAALTLDYGVGSPTDIPNNLPLWRVNIASGQKTPFVLTVPPRTGCTAMNYQRSIPDVRFTNRYLYVFRQDSCGKFITRYDWHASRPEPLVYPDQRPPTPAPRK